MRTLFFVCVIDVLGFGILIPLMPYMADRYGAPPELITPIFGSYSLAQLLAAPLWGRLSDRYGRRPILISSLAGACVSYLMLGLANDVWWLLASRVLAGFMAGNLAAAFAYAADISKAEDRASSMGLVGAAIGIGFMLGPFIGGALAGEDERTANFLLPALLSASLSLLAMALVIFVLPESNPPERHTQRPTRGPTPVRLLVERPSLRFIVAAAFLLICSQAMLESIFAIWAKNRFGFGPFTVGIVLCSLALIAVLMQARVVRVLAPRWGEQRLAAGGVLAYVAGLLTVAAGANLPLTIAGLALCGLGYGAFNPSASALASRQSTPADRGAVMGTYQSGLSLARATIPFASGALYSGVGHGAPFLFGAIVTLPAAWLIWRSASGPSTVGSG
jgi:multidrug resistance protein